MKNYKNFSRRDVTRQIGIVAGISLLGPGITRAALQTPEQTDGPFYPIGEQADRDMDLTLIDGHAETAEGETILVRGCVFDTGKQPLDDVLIDIWQANHFGRYSHPADKNCFAHYYGERLLP